MSTENGTPAQALLVTLKFNLCPQTLQLKDEAEKIEEENHANKGTTRASIYFFKKEGADGKTIDALAEIKSYFSAWKSEHKRLTRTWDGGDVTCLLPAPLIERYMSMKKGFEDGAPEVLDRLYADIPNWIESAPERMGALHDPETFPSLETVRESVGWQTAMIPLPAAEQWRRISVISPDLAATMEQNTNERIQSAIAEATQQTWADLQKPLEKIVETLSKDKGRIFECLLGNLNDVISLVPAFNLGNDTGLAQFCETAKQTLSGITADDLRNDPELRKVTCNAAKMLLGQFGQASGRKFA